MAKQKTYSEKYILLMYYVHSYLESVKGELCYNQDTTVENFEEAGENERHCEILCEHSLTQYNYELSHNQVCNGINLFLKAHGIIKGKNG